jgi:mitochondrial fission protein ELM1
MLRGITAWILTDGKAGDELPCLGAAEALGLAPELRRVRPRAPYAWLMPWGPIDPRERPGASKSPIAPPFPDLVIASGRRAVPSLRYVKRASGGRTYTVFLKDPRAGPGSADFIWAPAYDRIRGPNVLTTLTSPHRITAARLAAARAEPDPRVAALPAPRVAVLAGGDSRHHRFTDADVARFTANLETLAATGVSLLMTVSRRTPPPLRAALLDLARRRGGFFWDGAGENPYIALLALSDAVIVTADSFNMVGEAAATGVPVLVFEPSGGHMKLRTFLDGLKRLGVVHDFDGHLVGERYPPVDATPIIAAAIEEGFNRHRRGLAQAPMLSE